MLLEFQFQNYKSFHGATSFSMKAESEQHGLDYSLFDVAGDDKVLCCSAIYGPNAAGKTSIIGAMDALRAIVRRGISAMQRSSAQPITQHLSYALFLTNGPPNLSL